MVFEGRYVLTWCNMCNIHSNIVCALHGGLWTYVFLLTVIGWWTSIWSPRASKQTNNKKLLSTASVSFIISQNLKVSLCIRSFASFWRPLFVRVSPSAVKSQKDYGGIQSLKSLPPRGAVPSSPLGGVFSFPASRTNELTAPSEGSTSTKPGLSQNSCTATEVIKKRQEGGY